MTIKYVYIHVTSFVAPFQLKPQDFASPQTRFAQVPSGALLLGTNGLGFGVRQADRPGRVNGDLSKKKGRVFDFDSCF